MALMDDYLEMFDAQSLATVKNITFTSDVIDLGAAGPDTGVGTPVWAHVRIGTAVDGAGTATITTTLQHSAVGSTYTTIEATSALTPTLMAAGTRLIERALPANVKRYIRVICVTATSTITAGTVDAWLDLGPQFRS